MPRQNNAKSGPVTEPDSERDAWSTVPRRPTIKAITIVIIPYNNAVNLLI